MITLPRSIVLEVTARCNYSCPYCYCLWHESDSPAPRDLSTEKWKRIIDICAKHQVNDLTFSGGEALLRKDLKELISYAKKTVPGCTLSLFTNASRMTEEFFFFCKEEQVSLAASLQGLRTYGAMTGTRRSYRKMLDWIAFGAENEWKFHISMTATQANKNEFADMFTASVFMGAATIQMGAMMPQGHGKKHLDLTLSRQEWNDLKNIIRALPDGGVPFSFTDEMICECRPQPPELLKRFAAENKDICTAGKDFGVISPDGTYRKCLHFPEALIIDDLG